MGYTVDQFLVPGVSSDHCVRAITKEVGAIQGVRLVVVNLEAKSVRVEHDGHVGTATLLRAIKRAGYDEVALLV
jgi:copper chaperone